MTEEVKEATAREQPKIKIAIDMFKAGRDTRTVRQVTGLTMKRMKELNLIADFEVPNQHTPTGKITLTRPLVERAQ